MTRQNAKMADSLVLQPSRDSDPTTSGHLVIWIYVLVHEINTEREHQMEIPDTNNG